MSLVFLKFGSCVRNGGIQSGTTINLYIFGYVWNFVGLIGIYIVRIKKLSNSEGIINEARVMVIHYHGGKSKIIESRHGKSSKKCDLIKEGRTSVIRMIVTLI